MLASMAYMNESGAKRFGGAIFVVLLLSQSFLSHTKFGGWAIDKKVYDYLVTNLAPKSTILELGSGYGTGQLAKHFSMVSVEHLQKWLGKYQSRYIYAPLRDGWYDTTILSKELPTEYDAILIDGPPGSLGRGRIGFFENIHLFNTDVMIVVDDVHRPREKKLLVALNEKLQRGFHIIDCKPKQAAVIPPK